MPTRPNILLFLADQHRPDWLGFHGRIPVRTPNIDALAERGVTYSSAICPSPLCAPSRACFASGREYDRCRVPSNGFDFPLDLTTYYRLLRDKAGYHVLGVGKFDLHKASYTWGTEGKHLLAEWGFSDGIDNAGKIDAIRSGQATPKDPYMAFLHGRGLAGVHVRDMSGRQSYAATHPTPLPDDAYCDNWIAQNGLGLLADAPRDRPWHLVVNFAGPHNPLDITQAMAHWYEQAEFPQPIPDPDPTRGGGLAPQVHTQIRRNYSAMVENIDRWVGRFLALVKERGELENTLIVYSADHGEMLGDRGRWAKTQPFQASVGIPLVIAGPDIARGAECAVPTSLIDVSATFLEAAGVAMPNDFDAASLSPTLATRARPHRRCAVSGLGPWRLAFDGRYKLIEGYAPGAKFDAQHKGAFESPGPVAGGEPFLYDLEADPQELRNLASLAPLEVERLRALAASPR